MTAKRKLLIFFTGALLLLSAVLLSLWTNLDWLVKSAIERYGSQATGTRVRVAGVDLRPLQGKGTIEGLTVANPRGYSAPHILSLGGISVRLEPRTAAANPVVIDDIRIAAPVVVYEMNDDGVANIDALKKNLGAGHPAKTAAADKKGGREKSRLLRIRRLVIEHATVNVRIAALGDKPRSLTLSRIEMADIGGKNGAPPDDVATQIVTALLSEVSKEIGKAGASRLLENALERALRRK